MRFTHSQLEDEITRRHGRMRTAIGVLSFITFVIGALSVFWLSPGARSDVVNVFEYCREQLASHMSCW